MKKEKYTLKDYQHDIKNYPMRYVIIKIKNQQIRRDKNYGRIWFRNSLRYE